MVLNVAGSIPVIHPTILVMEQSKYVNLSGRISLFNQLQVTNNNIANSNSPGYQKGIAITKQYNHGHLTFANDISVAIDRSVGGLKQTGNPLDLAISTPNNYFAVESTKGVRYTRNGAFVIDENAQLANSNGLPVLNREGKPISFNTGEVNKIFVDTSGVVFNNGEVVDRIGIFTFVDLGTLRKEGATLLRTENEARLVENAHVLQGILEDSNSSSIIEIKNLIDISRSFDQATNFANNVNKLSNDIMQVLLRNE